MRVGVAFWGFGFEKPRRDSSVCFLGGFEEFIECPYVFGAEPVELDPHAYGGLPVFFGGAGVVVDPADLAVGLDRFF